MEQPTESTQMSDMPDAINSLMQIEVPISISFGSARVPLRELLALDPGSIVELDQDLADPVEIHANNCLIARGEVVAVDGNYGIRILELVTRRPDTALDGSTK